MKDDVDHDDDETEFASSSSVSAEGEGESSIVDEGKKCSSKESTKCPVRDLRGIVMDAVIVGAPLCSTVWKKCFCYKPHFVLDCGITWCY